MTATPAAQRISEASFQRAVTELAQTLGWRVGHISDSRKQLRSGRMVGDRAAAGLPDLFMVRGTRLLLVELKALGGRLRPAQREWLEDLQRVEADAAGRLIVRVWTPEDWDTGEIARTLARRAA